jgi:hypothetical protein
LRKERRTLTIPRLLENMFFECSMTVRMKKNNLEVNHFLWRPSEANKQ